METQHHGIYLSFIKVRDSIRNELNLTNLQLSSYHIGISQKLLRACILLTIIGQPYLTVFCLLEYNFFCSLRHLLSKL